MITTFNVKTKCPIVYLNIGQSTVCINIKSRRTTREFLDKEVDFEAIKRILENENIFLAATAEGLQCSMRIPLNEEHDIRMGSHGQNSLPPCSCSSVCGW